MKTPTPVPPRIVVAILFAVLGVACQSTGDVAEDTSPEAAADTVDSGQAKVVPAVVGIPPEPGPGGDYRIGPHDLLEIEVFQAEELSSKERVNDEGAIIMPLIGSVKVGGLTPIEAEALIAARLARDYLQDPQVNLFVEEYASQKVTVAGAVEKPGVYPLTGPTTLLQALAEAEGLHDLANPREIVLFRDTGDGSMLAYVIDVQQIERGDTRDPSVIGGDRVVVPKSGTAVFLKGVADTLRGFVRIPI